MYHINVKAVCNELETILFLGHGKPMNYTGNYTQDIFF